MSLPVDCCKVKIEDGDRSDDDTATITSSGSGSRADVTAAPLLDMALATTDQTVKNRLEFKGGSQTNVAVSQLLRKNAPLAGGLLGSTAILLVIKQLVQLQELISRYGSQLANVLKSLKVWIRANPKATAAIVVGIIQFSLACGIPAILSAIGFSASGPLLGSVAAGWQASIGSVAAGSLFAFLQSAAMGGTAVGLFNGIGALALLVAIGGRLATVEFVKEKFGEMAVKMGEVASVVKDGWQDLERSIGDLWRNAKNIFTKNSTSG